MMVAKFPDAFARQFQDSFGLDAWNQWLNAFEQTPPTSIRLHPDKKIPEDATWTSIPWNPLGRYIPKRPVFTLDPLFHAGSYYVQEAASQFLWQALEQCVGEQKNIKILDLCGAPGGKSSLVASFVREEGLLVSNEIIKNRAYVLKANMEKTGYSNVVVTNNDPADLASLHGFFDVILVDAPCSGEGMFRKDPNAIEEWSPDHVLFCASRQKRILADVLPSLKTGGWLIYSTCTLNRHENIENVDWACQDLGMTSFPIPAASDFGIPEIRGAKGYGYQFSPHTHEGEGLFISILQKSKEEKDLSRGKRKSLDTPGKKIVEELEKTWSEQRDRIYFTDPNGDFHMIPAYLKNDMEILLANTRVVHAGINLGTFKQDSWIPHHGQALALNLSDHFQKVHLDRDQSLAYLKKSLDSIDFDKKGWLLTSFQGHGLGWMKNLGNRINNYLPNEARIRMEITKSDDFEE